MSNALNQALAEAYDLEEIKEHTGLDLTLNMSQGAKNQALDVMLEAHAKLRQELHDHASIIGQMEYAGQRASEQEWGIFVDEVMQIRGFWNVEDARTALEVCVPREQWGKVAIRRIGTRTRASRAIEERVSVFQALKKDYDTTSKTIEALQAK